MCVCGGGGEGRGRSVSRETNSENPQIVSSHNLDNSLQAEQLTNFGLIKKLSSLVYQC